MTKAKINPKPTVTPKPKPQITKALTGINGLDIITEGGLPKGRASLICGGTGTGKTMLAMEFLLRGAQQFHEPGVFMAFEESTNDLIANVASIGFDLQGLITTKKVVVDFVYIERDEIVEAGEYNLEALFIRLGAAIDSIGAKRVVLDTIESLFSSLPNPAVLRAELRRMFRWLKEKGVTAVITGEGGTDTLSRQGIEEYVSDCVIDLSIRIEDRVASRKLRIVKYRGSSHGTNEYPFVIDNEGISLIPITSSTLEHAVSTKRVSSGIPRLDTMLGGAGFFEGSVIMVSGPSGTGKTTFMSHFADAACRRNERAVYFSFEESPAQIIRNMSSVGLNLDQWVKKGLLRMESRRTTQCGLDMHLVLAQKLIAEHAPNIVIMDPVTSFEDIANTNDVKRIVMKFVDHMKSLGITTMFGSLTPSGLPSESSAVNISSLIDTWILLRDLENNGERNRGIYILKSRGMNHSNQVREFLLSDHGVEICDVYVGSGGVATGGARLNMLAQEKALGLKLQEEMELRQFDLENKRNVLDSKIAAMRAEFAAQEAGNLKMIAQEKTRQSQLSVDRTAMGKVRNVDERHTPVKAKRKSK
ncbi:MAG: circadian clock protein KaiC [Chlorobiaceae bacterium]|nr:circadian clock protein KaiC [Chlorobiaceae bacterium]